VKGVQLALGFVGALALASVVSPRGSAARRRRPRTATLFSGGGLVEVGLEGLIDPVFAVEFDPKIAAVYEAAHGPHVEVEDVRTVTLPRAGSVDYLHASPVCKSFSVAKREVGERDLDIETARATARAIRRLRPRVFTLENVSGYKGSVALGLIEDALRDEGYTFDARVYDAADYGAATHRDRLLLRAVREGALPPVPFPTHPKGRQADWYAAVSDLVDAMPDVEMPKAKKREEDWLTPRLRASQINVSRLDRPLLVLGGSMGKGSVPYAYAGGPAPTLKATYREVHRIFLPDGRIKRLTPRGMARITGLPDDYPLPKDPNLAVTVIGNGVPPALSRAVFGPLLERA
jgi:DNA (cytosine-5)-methyltransferase 1